MVGETDRAPPRARKRAEPARAAAVKPSWRRKLLRRPFRTFVAAVFGALLCGILVNAIALQRGHHPAPLFGRRSHASPPRLAEPAPAPPPRPADFASPSIAAPAPLAPALSPLPKSEDARRVREDEIGELIETGAPPGKHAERTVTAVQKALRKLGFPVKATGDFGVATRQALERFERDRRLPISGELSPRLIHALEARSGLPIPQE